MQETTGDSERASFMGSQIVVDEGGGAWADLGPHPIRRWIARLFDFWVTTGLVFVALALPWIAAGPDLEAAAFPVMVLGVIFLLSPLRGLLAAALNALLLSRFSTTPGKWLCGVRIRREDGSPPAFTQGFRRELAALTFGCGFYVPLISVVAVGYNFFRLRAKGAAPWDQRRGLVAAQRPNSPKQVALTCLALAPVLVILMVFAVAMTVLDATPLAAGG